MNISRLHHAAIICSDYARSKRFYVETLGFSIISETYRAARGSYKLNLRVGGSDELELFSFPDPPSRVTDPEARGLRHLAFAVDDVETAAAMLKAKGVRVEDIRVDTLTGQRFVFFRDPDDLPLELYETRRST